MFIPIEGALAAALASRASVLTGYAAERNVAIATPATLMIALRTIDNVWQVERRNQNAEAIASRAGQLYDDKFVGFVDDLQNIGRGALAKRKGAYTEALGKLQSSSGNTDRPGGKVEEFRGQGRKVAAQEPVLAGEPGVVALPDPGLITGRLRRCWGENGGASRRALRLRRTSEARFWVVGRTEERIKVRQGLR